MTPSPKRGKRTTARRKGARRPKSRTRAPKRRAIDAVPAEVREIESLRTSLEKASQRDGFPRWNADPDEVRRSVVKLVLTLVELIRQLLERQAIRRMDAQTLTPEQVEAIGLALMRLEETIRDLGAQFDLTPEELNLDLGPLGRLM
jgi:hypothetical protein